MVGRIKLQFLSPSVDVYVHYDASGIGSGDSVGRVSGGDGADDRGKESLVERGWRDEGPVYGANALRRCVQ